MTEIPDFSGLNWTRNLWGSEPQWTTELNEEIIKQTAQTTLGLPGHCTIEFLAQGAFNKIYVVKSTTGRDIIARVTLPVDPKWKTLSEVATISWVRQNTGLPVPEVLAYKPDRSNTIGFEWILMNKVPGKTWADSWKDIPFSAKEDLVCQIVRFCADTFKKQMQGIGNLFLDKSITASTTLPYSTAAVGRPEISTEALSNIYSNEKPSRKDLTKEFQEVEDSLVPPGAAIQATPSFSLRRIVSAAFIWHGRIHYHAPRGPFASSKDWLQARLILAEHDCNQRLIRLRNLGDDTKDANDNNSSQEDSDEEDDLEDLEGTADIISRLNRHLDDFFPAKDIGPEPSMIFHDDLNRHNILIKDGVLTGVIDWECISVLPLWVACQFPSFLRSKLNEEEPNKSKYTSDTGEVSDLYWEQLESYQLTRLRRLFLAEMQRLQPGWVEVFESSQRLRDFDFALTCCDDPFLIRRIRNWLDDMDSGKEDFEGLEERIDNDNL